MTKKNRLETITHFHAYKFLYFTHTHKVSQICWGNVSHTSMYMIDREDFPRKNAI